MRATLVRQAAEVMLPTAATLVAFVLSYYAIRYLRHADAAFAVPQPTPTALALKDHTRCEHLLRLSRTLTDSLVILTVPQCGSTLDALP